MRARGVLGVMFIVALVVLSVLVPAVSATPAVPVPRPGNPPRTAPPPTIPPPRPVKVRFMGTVVDIDEGTEDEIWTLDTLGDTPGDTQEIVVNDDTRFVEALGEAEEGARVWVLAQVQVGSDGDSFLLALIVMVREPRPEQGEPVHFSGEIERLPGEGPEGTRHEDLEGTWKVVGYEAFLVTDRTIILPDGVAPVEGDWARVDAFRQADGSLWAKKVTVLETGIDEIDVNFTGIIEVYPEDSGDPDHPYTGDWVISNITVTCAITTQVVGTPEVGLLARVKAVQQPNGDLIATKIQIRNAPPVAIKFRGIIHSFPTEWPPEWPYRGEWLIGVVNVFADENTVINGTPAIGLMARVEGLPQTNGGVLATVITVEEEPPGPREIEFTGTIERLPKHWQHGVWIVVSEEGVERQVLVSSRTQLPLEKPDVGTNVHVVGTETGGVVHASEIVVNEVNGEDLG